MKKWAEWREGQAAEYKGTPFARSFAEFDKKIRAFLQRIYQAFTGTGGKATPEVEEVMARMISIEDSSDLSAYPRGKETDGFSMPKFSARTNGESRVGNFRRMMDALKSGVKPSPRVEVHDGAYYQEVEKKGMEKAPATSFRQRQSPMRSRSTTTRTLTTRRQTHRGCFARALLSRSSSSSSRSTPSCSLSSCITS